MQLSYRTRGCSMNHAAWSKTYIIIFVTAYIFFKALKHSEMKMFGQWRLSKKTYGTNFTLLKKKNTSIMILTCRFLIMLVAIIQISVPIHREVSFHIHHINTDIRQDLACCQQRSLVMESHNIKSGVTWCKIRRQQAQKGGYKNITGNKIVYYY